MMSFGGFVLAATLYVSLVIVFISMGIYLISFRFRSQQNQMLYYPEMPPESREICEDPVALGMPNSERVTVLTADKVRLRGFMLWPSAASHGQKASSADSNSSLTSALSQTAGAPGQVSVPIPGGGSGALDSSDELSPPSVTAANSRERSDGAGACAVHPAAPSSGTAPPFVLLYFHGNAGNVGHRLSLAQAFVLHLRCAVMMVDYRGFGLSDDVEPIQDGLELDAQACFDHLWQNYRVPRDRIVVMGTSLGGAVAIHLAANEKYARRIQAVIVENTFTSVGDMASALGRPILARLVSRCPGLAMGVFEYYIKPLALRIGWHSIRKVRQVAAPMLFLSGGQDELVPPEQMRGLYKEATKCLRDGDNGELTVPLRRFQGFEHGMHNNLPLMPGYMNVIQRFLADVNQGSSSGVI
ncbi:Bem46-like serine peptidase [Leptomonas pyrrhocoris]|uniref:Bem46-like serine peptidase n=1 Tax=Leptomonas pyrrhocoris TaxID=157538 RepID=A0A0M9GAV3_LEPPY|nr:Bem46-like serine peptidase [Leptomonas pyrrhocoris]KPA86487.1 Bem46-like serine peptidase [Leptomonas pyrrhocoris]|eukprot:XP_015664926.1 Bem46-like serine peptidase [Leptomonas pyrrhocoris]